MERSNTTAEAAEAAEIAEEEGERIESLGRRCTRDCMDDFCPLPPNSQPSLFSTQILSFLSAYSANSAVIFDQQLELVFTRNQSMRILYVDIDSLRPDHLGCYGYHRNTSPAIDAIAAQGIRFDNIYTSDAPCLPSRTAFATGRFGINTGVVNHGGTAADPYRVGPSRGFRSSPDRFSLFECLDQAGFHVASISPFPNRHAAWHFLAGVREYHNPGSHGQELADQVNKSVLPWISRHGREDRWFLHINYWDPHRPYRTPESFGNPFANDPPPAWMTEEIRRRHWDGCGLQCAQDPNDGTDNSRQPRMPKTISSMAEYRRWVDGYDVGIRYADDHLGQVIAMLKEQGVWEETAVIITADHGENQGELNYYGAHRTGDYVTHRVPLIVRWPGVVQPGAAPVEGLCYSLDLSATILDILGINRPALWDGRSFSPALSASAWPGREHLVLSQMACMAQRSVRFGDWIVMRTWHDGFSGFPPVMLFNVRDDPHEQHDLAAQRPDVVAQGLQILERWQSEMLAAPATGDGGAPLEDPLATVLRNTRSMPSAANLRQYLERLRATGRGRLADALERRPQPVGLLG